ncbi:putative permease, DMT superfamily [Spirochaeta africana DSM 8902]|uniref:Putative permease, DMT superfamily n=2 Tax=Spirochaeta TaxID=146 RepID=H9UMJ0_SPIAZ|nr:putative permease, DMT superfamily [Spirochaeta africana DSM 8902]
MAVYLGLVTAMAFYGLSFISTKAVLQELGPVGILLIRISLSSLLLHLVYRLQRSRKRQRIAAGDLRFFMVVALFQPFLYFMSENLGLDRVSPAVASIIIGTIPVVTPAIAAPLLGERLSRLNIIGLVVSLAGVAVITGSGDGTEISIAGILLLFGAVLAAAGYAVAVRRVPAHYDAFTIVRMQNLLGIPMVLPFFLLFEVGAGITVSATAALHLGFLSVFPSTISFILLSNGIRQVGAGRANAFANLVPVFTAGFSVLFLAEPVVLRVWLGMALVIAGVSIAQQRHTPRTGIQES